MLDDAKKETEFAKKNWNKIAKEKIEEGKKKETVRNLTVHSLLWQPVQQTLPLVIFW